jgi:hypothetical protein
MDRLLAGLCIILCLVGCGKDQPTKDGFDYAHAPNGNVSALMAQIRQIRETNELRFISDLAPGELARSKDEFETTVEYERRLKAARVPYGADIYAFVAPVDFTYDADAELVRFTGVPASSNLLDFGSLEILPTNKDPVPQEWQMKLSRDQAKSLRNGARLSRAVVFTLKGQTPPAFGGDPDSYLGAADEVRRASFGGGDADAAAARMVNSEITLQATIIRMLVFDRLRGPEAPIAEWRAVPVP